MQHLIEVSKAAKNELTFLEQRSDHELLARDRELAQRVGLGVETMHEWMLAIGTYCARD
jgi:hypothetical protein